MSFWKITTGCRAAIKRLNRPHHAEMKLNIPRIYQMSFAFRPIYAEAALIIFRIKASSKYAGQA